MTRNHLSRLLPLLLVTVTYAQQPYYLDMPFGHTLPGSTENVILWWASSGWKVSPQKTPPTSPTPAITIRAARNEAEAAQLIIHPRIPLTDLTLTALPFKGSGSSSISPQALDILEVRYVEITQPTDKTGRPGPWPDPLPPINKPLNLQPDRNYPFWLRITVPATAPAGIYLGAVRLEAQNYKVDVPIRLEVYDFTLPDRMSCTTAFGFSTSNVFRYHKLTDPEQKRQVLEKYWANFSAHHISPYNPAPLDPIRVTWPKIKPPTSKWSGGQTVTNEKHAGQRALLILDDRRDQNVTATYEPLIEIPSAGLRLSFYFRTAIPNHPFLVSLNHYDQDRKWIYGRNNDIAIEGTGTWQKFDQLIKNFPPNARYVRLNLHAAVWTEAGEKTGLVWFDDVSLTDPATGKQLIEGGDFEPPALEQPDEAELTVRFDFSAWDKAIQRAIDKFHFNSFRLTIPGLGGGTFHARYQPQLLGFSEDTPHYKILFNSYCRQLQEHLRERGWLDEAYIYWFDEPAPKDYAFVMNGFRKLIQAAPDLNRMLTEQIEPQLVGGPNIWCPVSPNYKPGPARERQELGEKIWWYICTGPKAPYCTLFIDHPGTELRVWLWQTWQRNIEGILIWQTNYWTSSAAYPDPKNPQNPYLDPMSWVSGYSTPKGRKRPWGNGDGRFIYPPEAAADAHPPAPVLDGPVDSIRWEMLRDGIEDYEYLTMLKALLDRKEQKLSPRQARYYRSLLEVPSEITTDMTIFTKDPAPIEKRRDLIAHAIAKLRRL